MVKSALNKCLNTVDISGEFMGKKLYYL